MLIGGLWHGASWNFIIGAEKHFDLSNWIDGYFFNKISDFIDEHFKQDVNYFEKKNKVKININSNDKLNLSEFFIEYKSKSKKVIEKVEKLESLSKIVVENKNQKLKKNIQKKIFKKKKYRKKFIVKS